MTNCQSVKVYKTFLKIRTRLIRNSVIAIFINQMAKHNGGEGPCFSQLRQAIVAAVPDFGLDLVAAHIADYAATTNPMLLRIKLVHCQRVLDRDYAIRQILQLSNPPRMIVMGTKVFAPSKLTMIDLKTRNASHVTYSGVDMMCPLTNGDLFLAGEIGPHLCTLRDNRFILTRNAFWPLQNVCHVIVIPDPQSRRVFVDARCSKQTKRSLLVYEEKAIQSEDLQDEFVIRESGIPSVSVDCDHVSTAILDTDQGCILVAAWYQLVWIPLPSHDGWTRKAHRVPVNFLINALVVYGPYLYACSFYDQCIRILDRLTGHEMAMIKVPCYPTGIVIDDLGCLFVGSCDGMMYTFQQDI